MSEREDVCNVSALGDVYRLDSFQISYDGVPMDVSSQ